MPAGSSAGRRRSAVQGIGAGGKRTTISRRSARKYRKYRKYWDSSGFSGVFGASDTAEAAVSIVSIGNARERGRGGWPKQLGASERGPQFPKTLAGSW